LTEDKIDIAIGLTDPFIAGIAKGSSAYKLVGTYVTSPLNWAVITGKESKYGSIRDLKGTVMGVSRIGSGSWTMASIMALQQGWDNESLDFKVNNDIAGLISSVNDGTTSAFMWEWFTTKPFVDDGKARFIGSVPTPWPSWMIAAHPSPDRAPPEAVSMFLDSLSERVQSFNSEEKRQKENVEYIKKTFGYQETDIIEWLKTVSYPDDCAEIHETVVIEASVMLIRAGVIHQPTYGYIIGDFVNEAVAKLV